MSTAGRWAVVVAGGPGEVVLRDPLPAGAFVVAADSGLDRAAALGLPVDVVVGDFDSVSGVGLSAAQDAGVRLERHPREKDATDLELALELAVGSRGAGGAGGAGGADHVLVVAGDTGRFDHTMANLLLLASDRFAAVSMFGVVGAAMVTVIRSRSELHGSVGALVSLLAVGGVASGIVTEGLLYPLRGDDHLPGSSRGVSNEFSAARAVVSVASGVLVAVQPG
jgi:thiamine pyrophosphokinase